MRSKITNLFKALRLTVVISMVAALLTPLATVTPASAASVTGASFSGGAGTASVGGTLYARQGAALTLTVGTDNTTKCVRVTDGTTTVDKDSSSAQTSWTFTSADSGTLFTAGSGNGVKSVTATAYRNSNGQHHCTANGGEDFGIQTASHVLDNTGPVVTGVVTPTPNGAGWNKSDVTITWSATDAGSGVATGPTPATDSVTADTAGVTKTATATDALGNSGSGSVTVKLDKTAPTLNISRAPAANANGWNNTDVTVSISCADALSGIKSCTGSTTTLSSEGANLSVSASAVDNADNSGSTSVGPIKIDKTAPTLSGAPTTGPNGAGWYNGNVTIHWTASDALSGLAGSAPADSTISSEGTGLTASASIADNAGNTTNASSSPAVKIDKTAPNTVPSAPVPTNWNNVAVTVNLNAGDAGSGIAATYYKLDGGAEQSGTSVPISADGIHTLQFWSVDNAGNTEAVKSVQVKIDRTPPTINHTQSPAANGVGWNKTDVTVHFICADATSGLASCTGWTGAPPSGTDVGVTVTTEGKDRSVPGTALDNAGNTATDPAVVSIDKTAPTVTGAPDRAANGNGWYDDDVTVSFAASDALSGIAVSPAPVVLQEGANQSASGSATDAAGNTASATINGINIDKTAPSLSGVATMAPNGNGWYNGDVTVHWTAADALSGLATPAPTDSTITGEGNNLSASASVSDLAGNSTSATVSGIKIDRSAPSTLASVPAPLESGWYAGDVLVTLTTGADLSGVAATYYSVDGGAAQPYTAPFNHTLRGNHTITFWSVDNAGNVEAKTAPDHTITLKIDGVPPTITGSRVPAANSFGWNNSSVTVIFYCSDAESDIAGCVGGTTLSNEGAGQSVAGQAQDNAGNTNTASVSDINIDLTAPTLSGAATTAANAAGWYNGDVTIHWTGQDSLSDIDPATQPANSVITVEGLNLGAGPVSISDKAGNSTSASVSGIKIDRTAPTISASVAPAANSFGWNNSDVTITFTCSDALSGIPTGGCPAAATLTNSDAEQTVTRSVSDNAGNSASVTVSHISIDKIPPTLSGAPTTAANSAGWYKNNVTIHWTAADALSDLNPATVPANSIISSEGSALTVSASVSDKAGNTTSATSPAVQIDKTAPTISGATVNDNGTPRSPNAAGWFNSAVRVRFTCNDTLSTVAECSSETVLDHDGANQSASGTATDRADNSAGATVSGINIDSQAPSTVADLQCTGANGWCRGNQATVVLTAQDQAGLSGVKELRYKVGNNPNWNPVAGATASVNINLNGSGRQSVQFYAVDNAGNSEVTGAVEVRYDTLAPSVNHALAPAANAAGWNNADFAVSFTATDDSDGSGAHTLSIDGTVVASRATSTPAPLTGSKTISTETSGQTVNASADDFAGNVGTDSVPVKLDKTRPTIGGGATSAPNGNGWYNGAVTVHFTCADSGAVQSGIASCTGDQVLTTDGANQSVPGTTEDRAGNTASTTVSGISIDTGKPTITGAPTTAANTYGWYTGPVTIHFTCGDARSGIPANGCPADVTLNINGANQSVTRSVSDLAGNTQSVTVSGISIDMTAPTIAASLNPAAPDGTNGWYKTAVTVHFTCADTGSSGVVDCPADVSLNTDGANQSVTRSASDQAGNSTSVTVSGINIDRTNPIITGVNVANQTYTLGDTVPAPTCTATDATSGVASCTVSVTHDNTYGAGVGRFNYTATATDNAGNTTTPTGYYTVAYRWDGFLQPINDTAHQVGTNTSIFKAGSTVPAKFQLKKADGTVVQANALPQWLTPVKGSATTAPLDETVYSDTPTAGGTYRWDATAQQYIYNWGTPRTGAGYYWRVGVTFDDGQTYYVNIGLR